MPYGTDVKQVKLNPDIAVILNPEILAKTKVLSAPKTVILFQMEIVYSLIRVTGGETWCWECLGVLWLSFQKTAQTLRPPSEGLLGLANKNEGCLVKFEFQIICG